MTIFPDHPRDPPEPVVDAAPAEVGVVKSAARVLRIFEFFDDVQRAARLNEICAALDLPASSTSALLHSLVKLGYLQVDAGSRGFVPTSRIAMLGSWAAGDLGQDGWFLRVMDELSAQTGQTISIAARNGIYAQYIRVEQATTPLRVAVPTGTRRLLAWSASGTVLLGAADEAEIAAVVRRTNAERLPGQPRVDTARVLENVALFRRQGYFFSRGMVVPGAGHIAMAMPSAGATRQPQVHALGVAGWIEELERNEARIVRQMRTALQRRAAGQTRGEKR